MYHTDQKVPVIDIINASFSNEQEKTKAYYFRSYEKTPDKLVCNNIMKSFSSVIELKKISFDVHVSDLSAWSLNNGL